MEAMVAGIPSIATDIPGCRPLIEDGKNGLLFQKGDDEELMQKIVVALSNDNKMKIYAKRARKHIQNHFSAERMAREYENVYKIMTGREYC
jgi:glycosyltransferase involved in cell wall biosynthesis